MTSSFPLSPPLDHAWIAAHIPHSGTMCLLERLEAWDERAIHCTTTTHARADHPLRTASGLLSPCLIEYAAQAMDIPFQTLTDSLDRFEKGLSQASDGSGKARQALADASERFNSGGSQLASATSLAQLPEFLPQKREAGPQQHLTVMRVAPAVVVSEGIFRDHAVGNIHVHSREPVPFENIVGQRPPGTIHVSAGPDVVGTRVSGYNGRSPIDIYVRKTLRQIHSVPLVVLTVVPNDF